MEMQQQLEHFCIDSISNARASLKRPACVVEGVLAQCTGQLLVARGCVARVGEICRIESSSGDSVDAIVAGFDEQTTRLFAYDDVELLPGARVVPLGRGLQAPIGHGLLGRVVDSAGAPLDGRGAVTDVESSSIEGSLLNPLSRTPIDTPLDVGVRAINALHTLGRGQRVGLFAASGLGKSVLLGMMTRHTRADITVVCLLGERGREVREFVQDILGKDALERAVVVAVPADHTPLRRVSGARYATAIAEYFRDRGFQVLLLMDSLTRYAQAGRELGLSAGELPVANGYPPSVFVELPQLLERGGCAGEGSVTAVYTLLMEGDDFVDPLAEAAKAILDGHIVLSRELAESGHFPAIDILASTSRLKDAVTGVAHRDAAQKFIQMYSYYRKNSDLLTLGMYQRGDDPELDTVLDNMPAMQALLMQSIDEQFSFEQCVTDLQQLLAGV